MSDEPRTDDKATDSGPNWKRLLSAVDAARRSLRKSRDQQQVAVRQFAGSHYIASSSASTGAFSSAGSVAGRDDSTTPSPVNFMHVIVTTLSSFIAARAPQVLITTKHGNLKIGADRLELATNQTLNEIKIERTFQETAMDAMFSMGIIKTGIWPANKIRFETEIKNLGQPYAESIQYDDFVFDSAAKTFDDCSFMGHYYKVPMDFVKKSGLFKESLVKDLTPMDQSNFDKDGGMEIEAIGVDRTRQGENNDYLDYVELLDLYLPIERKEVTFVVSGTKDAVPQDPIREREYVGPEGGPYTILFFERPPGNIRPLPPAFQWMDMNAFLNQVFRKLERQARRMKVVGCVRDDEAAMRVRDCSDGEMVQADPGSVEEKRFGGPDPQLHAILISMKDLLLGALSGNVEAIGGLGALTETAKQDKMIRESASVRVNKMQEAMMGFAQEVVRKLAWYLFYDPMIDLPATKRLPNTGMEVPIRITEEDMEGDFLDYNFDLEPYSMQYQSPLERDRAIMQVLSETVFPILPLLQQQGIFIDFQRLMELRSKLRNLPELAEIITTQEPDEEQAPHGTPPQKFGGAPQQREVIRRNIPTGGTQQSRDANMVNTLLNGGVNPDQLASLGRERAV